MRPLYELPGAFRDWERQVQDQDGELTPELEAALDRLEGDLGQKVEAIAALVREAERESEAFRHEAAYMSHKAAVAVNRATRLRNYLMRNLQALGRVALTTPRFRVSIRKNSLPSIRWAGTPNEPPPEFLRIVKTVDLAAARAAVKEGTIPAGFEVHYGEHLEIR